MRKVFRMENLCCANCAAKMERRIRKLPGVVDASVDFFHQKMILEADEAAFAELREPVMQAVRRLEPDCRVLMDD
ncbi:MAG: cation transporter [Clostridia bacterium]|nr:cation transporter [Clostridia bacterium]MDO4749894.1 cation transporter [Eubacteriales bacterium]